MPLLIPIDVVNRARLFDMCLEREDRLNRGHIIWYVNDQVWKMEKISVQMQLLVESV